MRPSDVPTYVEHGAADIGITGKDVLLEQSRARGLRAARPRLRRLPMVLAARAGERPRRRGAAPARRVRIATKYPRIAARHFAETGRQAEIVEVKGSVELAPLTGLVDGDRRPDRDRHDAARERPGGARGDRDLHRAPDRQPGGAQAQGDGDRRARWSGSMRVSA